MTVGAPTRKSVPFQAHSLQWGKQWGVMVFFLESCACGREGGNGREYLKESERVERVAGAHYSSAHWQTLRSAPLQGMPYYQLTRLTVL